MYQILLASNQMIDWHSFFFGEEETEFLIEIMLRSIIMFTASLVTLRIFGRRGIRQGVFEVVVIITLGSAAGDAMFYSKVGVLPAVAVFIMIIALYKLVNFLVAKNKWFETIIEGKHVCIIEEGQFLIKNFKQEEILQNEFFSDLRLKGVSQLGQIESAYVEANGEVSLFYYPDKDVKYGLPLKPNEFEKKYKKIPEIGIYACAVCGRTEKFEQSDSRQCIICKSKSWVVASNRTRVG